MPNSHIVSEDIPHFKEWMTKNNIAKGKVINDIASRTKRASLITNILSNEDTSILLLLLDKNQSFLQLSPSVKSQLKKAIKLYRDFKGIK